MLVLFIHIVSPSLNSYFSLDNLDIRVFSKWIPRDLYGYGYILFLHFKMIWMALLFCFAFAHEFNVVVVDQAPTTLPILWLYRFSKNLFKSSKNCKLKLYFYCHFPDKVLARQLTKPSFIRRLYRFPLDWFEEFCLSKHHFMVANVLIF